MKNRVWSLLLIFNLLCLMACQSDQATAVIPKERDKPIPVTAVQPMDSNVKPEPKPTALEVKGSEEKTEEEKMAAAQLEKEEAEKLKEEERRKARRKKRAEKREAEKLRQQELEAENQRLAEEVNTTNTAETNTSAGKLQFSDRSHDFGRIQEGDTIRHEFSFFNTGVAPIVITHIKASCGCTQTKYPEEPIMPGEKGTIGVTFDSKGKLGRQKPFISVTTNGFPKIYSLYLEGEVDTERL